MKRSMGLFETVKCGVLALAALASLVSVAASLPDVTIENARFRLVIGGDARAKSLVVKATGEDMLDHAEDIPVFSVIQDRPFCNEVKLTLPNQRTEFRADRVRREGDCLFIGFEQLSYEMQLRLTERPDYVTVELVDFPLGPRRANGLELTYPPVSVVKLLNLPVRDRAHFGDWLNVSWDDRAALSVFAAEPRTWIENQRRHGFRLMTAAAHRGVHLRGTKAVLMATAGKDFLNAMDVAERELGLPRGVESRRDPDANASTYWAADVNPTTVDRHLAVAKQGGFRRMLMYHSSVCNQLRWFNIADYEPHPKFPKGYESIREMLAKIKAAGIMPGLHVLQTFIGFDTHYISPVADPRLNLKRHFTLSRPLDEKTAGDLFVNEDPSDSPTNELSRILAFGGELIHYEGFTTERPYRFTGIVRGDKKTTPVAHPAGQIGGVLDVCEYAANSCYIDQNTDLQDEIAAKIAKIWDCGFEFMYNDGSEGVNVPQGIHVANAQYRVWQALAHKPLFMEGAAKSHFGWHHQAGGNAFDIFPPEIFKEMIVRWPLREAPMMADNFTRVDFGWWGVYQPGAEVRVNGRTIPTVGTQPDMWEFGTSKAAAWNCPAAVQAPDKLLRHPRGNDLLEVIRRWEDVRARRWLTDGQRELLKDPAREFHLYKNEKGGYELCEIEMLPTPAAANFLRGFVFERDGRRTVAYWHTSGEGTVDWALGPSVRVADLAYLETDLSRVEIRAAWSAATEAGRTARAVADAGVGSGELRYGWREAIDMHHVGETNGWASVEPAGVKDVAFPYTASFKTHDGEVWLYRTIDGDVPAGRRVFLELGGATYLLTAYLNGEKVGEHRGSYGDFAFDVTRHLRSGSKNLLALNLKCPTDGAFRVDGNLRVQSPVWRAFPHIQRVPALVAHDDAALADVFIRPDWKTGRLGLDLTFDATQASPALPVAVEVRAHKRDAVLARAEATVSVAAGRAAVAFPQPPVVPNFRLWSPDDPALYDVTVRAGGEVVTRAVGFRDFRVDDSGYFSLNGRRMFLKCTHMASEYPDALDLPVHVSEMYRTLLYLKTCGFNAVRYINCPAYPEVLDMCDEIGLMMYEEHPMAWQRVEGKNASALFRASVREIVLRDRNHACLTLFGLLNEVENSPKKKVFNQTAAVMVPELRTIAPDLLFMYHSGRWDAGRSIASASNPGTDGWTAWMGDEGPGEPPEPCKNPSDGSVNHTGRGDIHLYPRLPLNGREWGLFDRYLTGIRRAAFVSESGYGSMANVLEGYLHVAEKDLPPGTANHLMTSNQVVALRHAFAKYNLYSVWPTPEEMIKASELECARKRADLTTMIRRKAKVNGYSVTMAQDLNYYGEGLLETSGGLKRGMSEMLEEQLADLRFCVSATNRAVYAGAPFMLDVALSDFGVLKEGTDYPIALRIIGPDGIAWRRELTHRVAKGADGQRVPVVSLFAGDVSTAGWKPGRYQVGAEILEGAHADCGTLVFTVVAPPIATMLAGCTVHAVNGVHPSIQGSLRRAGATLCEAKVESLPTNGVIFVGWRRLEDAAIDQFVEAARKGARVVFLQPEAISTPGATGRPRRMPFEAGTIKCANNWLYHEDAIVVASPLTKDLTPPGILDTDFFADNWSNRTFLGAKKPDVAAIYGAYVGFGGRGQRDCEIGVQLGAYRVGRGWIVLNTLRLDLSGGQPATDLILRNLVTGDIWYNTSYGECK